MATPFNPEVHANLLALGFTHFQFEADWHDAGDCESGPCLDGGPSWDEYLRESDRTKVCVDEDGSVGFLGDADPFDFADPFEDPPTIEDYGQDMGSRFDRGY